LPKEFSDVRFAVIILALVAMILGPISGSATAHAVHSYPDATAAFVAEPDCDEGHGADAGSPDKFDGQCADHSRACMDMNGCRHLGCLSGGAVPGSADDLAPGLVCPAVPFADWDRPDGWDVAPPLDPPRSRA
jgi:hypothetical protein